MFLRKSAILRQRNWKSGKLMRNMISFMGISGLESRSCRIFMCILVSADEGDCQCSHSKYSAD